MLGAHRGCYHGEECPLSKRSSPIRQDGKFAASFEQLKLSQLPGSGALIRVKYSSLNYKDGLAVTGRPGVIRNFPMVPGVDFAGTVEEAGRRIQDRR